jgi:hypothetical protein
VRSFDSRADPGSETADQSRGRTAKIVVPLNATGRALLRRFGRLPVNLAVLLKQPTGSSGIVKTARATFHKRRRKH